MKIGQEWELVKGSFLLVVNMKKRKEKRDELDAYHNLSLPHFHKTTKKGKGVYEQPNKSLDFTFVRESKSFHSGRIGLESLLRLKARRAGLASRDRKPSRRVESYLKNNHL